MNLQNLTSEDLIKAEKILSELKEHYFTKGAMKAHSIVRAQLTGSGLLKNANKKNFKTYYKGYDQGVNDALNLIRDHLIFKTEK